MDSDKIAELVENEYANVLKDICKPVVKSNGVKEWTVLASIVGLDTVTNQYKVVSLATGVKVMSDSELCRSRGKIVHDTHAEILAIRGFNAVLHHQISNYTEKSKCDFYLIESPNEGATFRVLESWKFCLYISKMPCGDASMEDELEDTNEFEIASDDEIQFLDPEIKTILRGRYNYGKRNVVRTKPGRADSRVTFSKSCSDKLCIKQALSINNAITFNLLSEPVYLSHILVPNLNSKQLRNLQKSFSRLGDNIVKSIEFLTTRNKGFVDDKKSEVQTPSLMSSILLHMEEGMEPKQEAILNGIKNGFFVKGTKPLRKNCESYVSRHRQWQLYSKSEYSLSYLSFKKALHSRNELIKKVREKLSPDGWISTLPDDCAYGDK